ncbi:putative serine-threonine protein kinase, plant-type [Hibiscus syriacus]|uniref:non-specific serine/threonine protein kinase n=1 Tax=Hibiscus syriacus TaxID=106335 RepID=A0A6A2XQD7_HIBSY|nr:putative serine-threonine protein kinase, plant-type [Hibiscus syriacus]
MTASGYLVAATSFKRFTYGELKRATRGFREEIGRGGGGVVYKGVLPDHRVATMKRLNVKAHQGEDEFLAEVSTIGRLNHMNLIEMWGYCVEGIHRLLVYEYIENGSLVDNLMSNSLDWKKMFEIAMGTAKGLTYLHEECLEWVLHCDSQRVELLQDQGDKRLHGARVVLQSSHHCQSLLEMITGKNPGVGVLVVGTSGEKYRQRLETWVKGKKIEASGTSWIEEVLDPSMGDDCDRNELENVIEVAIKCTEADRHRRPSMSQVVQMLVGSN